MRGGLASCAWRCPMRYSFQVLNNSIPESVAAGDFSSEQEMKAQALNYLLELAREEARVLPCWRGRVARGGRGGGARRAGAGAGRGAGGGGPRAGGAARQT